MHATGVQCGVRAVVSEERFRTFVTGSISPFVKVVFHPTLGYCLLTYNHFWPYEIRGEPIGITRIVVVRGAVGVHIAEVVGVVVIRRTLPPNRSGTQESKPPTDRFYRNTPVEVKTIAILKISGSTSFDCSAV